jgi:hypothetical protein
MAEEIGKRIAQELSDRFTQIGMKILAQQSSINLGAQTFATLKRLAERELRGFNQVAPRGFRLNMLPGQSCLVFSFEKRLALTLKVQGGLVRLVPTFAQLGGVASEEAPPLASSQPCFDFVVTRDDSGFQFQQISRSPSAYTPALSEGDFIAGVLRVACGQPLERN